MTYQPRGVGGKFAKPILDDEIGAMQATFLAMRYWGFDSKHRALDYLCRRLLGDDWALPKRAKP